MIELAAVEPAWARVAVPLLGVLGFAALATSRQRRPTLVASLVVLATLVGIWLFAATLVGVVSLAITLGAVAAVAMALRSFSSDRALTAWGSTAVALGLFVAWSAGVRDSVAPGLIAVPFALAALVADALQGPSPALAARRRAVARGLVIATVTALIALWLIVSFLWLVLEQGENVYCNCWADHRGSWGYFGQFLLALAGSASLWTGAAAHLRRRRDVVALGGVAAAIAVGGWVGLLMSAHP